MARARKHKEAADFFSEQVSEARRFYLNRTDTAKQDLTVVSGGCEHCSADYGIDREDFPFYSIEFVVGGRGSVKLNDQEYELSPGVLFSYGPGIGQIIRTDAEDRLIKYFVDFVGPKAKWMLKHFAPTPGKAERIRSPEAIISIFEDLIRNGQSDSPYSPLICSKLVEYLIIKIAEAVVTDKKAVSAAFSTYQQCRTYIQQNCIKLNSLQEISQNCHIDAAYLCRLFKRFDRQSPYQYLLHQKMTIAAKRLQTSTALIKEVAYELGFNDPFHFSRSFKKVFGLSPDVFRRLR